MPENIVRLVFLCPFQAVAYPERQNWGGLSGFSPFLLQESGLKVKEYELLRKNFSDSGNFGESVDTVSF